MFRSFVLFAAAILVTGPAAPAAAESPCTLLRRGIPPTLLASDSQNGKFDSFTVAGVNQLISDASYPGKDQFEKSSAYVNRVAVGQKALLRKYSEFAIQESLTNKGIKYDADSEIISIRNYIDFDLVGTGDLLGADESVLFLLDTHKLSSDFNNFEFPADSERARTIIEKSNAPLGLSLIVIASPREPFHEVKDFGKRRHYISGRVRCLALRDPADGQILAFRGEAGSAR